MPRREASAITQISATVQPGCPTPPRLPPAHDTRNRGHLHYRGCQGARHPRSCRSPPRCCTGAPPPPRPASAVAQISAPARMSHPAAGITADICTVADARARGIRNYADPRHNAARMPRTATPPRTTRTPAEICAIANARARAIRNYADLRSSAARAPRRARRGARRRTKPAETRELRVTDQATRTRARLQTLPGGLVGEGVPVVVGVRELRGSGLVDDDRHVRVQLDGRTGQ